MVMWGTLLVFFQAEISTIWNKLKGDLQMPLPAALLSL